MNKICEMMRVIMSSIVAVMMIVIVSGCRSASEDFVVEWEEYEVREGDDWVGIAIEYEASLKALKTRNGEELVVGRKIMVPKVK